MPSSERITRDGDEKWCVALKIYVWYIVLILKKKKTTTTKKPWGPKWCFFGGPEKCRLGSNCKSVCLTGAATQQPPSFTAVKSCTQAT